MLGSDFHFDLLRKFTVLFGTLFADINITREDEDGGNVASIRVPLNYGPKEKFLARLTAQPNSLVDPATGADTSRSVAITLPRMGFEIRGFAYDADRKLKSVNRYIKQKTNDKTKIQWQYEPVPYNIGFNLYVMVKNVTDGTRIIEQILPFFTPDWQIKADLMPTFGQTFNVPIVLHQISCDDSYDKGDFTERRAIVWTLSFILKGLLFPAIQETGQIKQVIVNFYVPAAGKTIDEVIGIQIADEKIIITPGLTANGQPTSNASLSIPFTQITADDPYGFITEIDSSK
jgi:hypothetical protein